MTSMGDETNPAATADAEQQLRAEVSGKARRGLVIVRTIAAAAAGALAGAWIAHRNRRS
jgi:hypothetical protein